MAGEWRINVKGFTGDLISVAVPNPQEATVLDLKQLIHGKQSDLPPFLQRLTHRTAGGASTKLEDSLKLSAYPEVTNGCTLYLIRLVKFELYIHDARGNLHSLTVPSNEPENYSIAELTCLCERKVGQRMDEYQFQYKGRPVEETRHGRQLTLKTYGIKTGDTLFVMKIGFTLDITNPQVDLCFMVDCTGSMSSSIEAVKNNIKQLRDGLDAQYKGCDLRFAFVRYTDYDQPASTRTTWIDFTKSQPAFHGFVSAIRADGGGDAPEDIMGGLKTVFTNIGWRDAATKVLIHIADCPCHGTQYHNGCGDSYPNGDPAGISHDHMMEEVAKREVQYWFGYIEKTFTDKMIGVFNESLRRHSSNRMMIRQFEAMQPHEVREGVHNAVTSSVYASKAAMKASVRSYTLDPSVPNWSSIPEQRARKTPPPGVLTLHHLQEEFTLENPMVQISFKCAPNPFAEGEESIVFRGYDVTNRRDVVLKQSRRQAREYNSLEHYMMVLHIHTVAAAYAREFNSEKLKPPSTNTIELIPLDAVQCPSGSCYTMQPFVLGKFEKFNNNVGFVCSKSSLSPLLQAFSHYSWEKSGRSLLICDLQGIQNGSKVQLTDPAIHSQHAGSKFGVTDLGLAGIQRFFKTHACNDICRALALKLP